MLLIDGWDISCVIALRWLSLDFAGEKSTLVQVMAWCRQVASHYLSQCWPRSMSQWSHCVLVIEIYLEILLLNDRRCSSRPSNDQFIPWVLIPNSLVVQVKTRQNKLSGPNQDGADKEEAAAATDAKVLWPSM